MYYSTCSVRIWIDLGPICIKPALDSSNTSIPTEGRTKMPFALPVKEHKPEQELYHQPRLFLDQRLIQSNSQWSHNNVQYSSFYREEIYTHWWLRSQLVPKAKGIPHGSAKMASYKNKVIPLEYEVPGDQEWLKRLDFVETWRKR